MPTLGIDRDFLWAFGKLEASVQRRVCEVFEKFRQATHAGAHLEKIAQVRDDRLRSVRIDQFWRGVVLAPESGDTYTLLKVLPHDDAYDWARRRQVSVNLATGTIEVRDVTAIEEQMPRLAEHAAADPARLLDHVNDADLARLGIDAQILPVARMLTSAAELDGLRGVLPGPQFDVLLGLASGMSPAEVWTEVAAGVPARQGYDPDDVTAAVARSSDRVVLVSGPDELMHVFSYPFELWRVYLHPAQHRVAYGSYGGPARVTGGPGTGKTVTALHRAKHLAATVDAPRSILLTTFTRTLAQSLDLSLHLLVEDQQLTDRIEVRHVDQVANKLVTAAHGRLRILAHNDQPDWWRRLIRQHGLDVTDTFLAHEWRHVLLAQGISTLDGYLAPGIRKGRGKPLTRRQRELIWPALAGFSAELWDAGLWTYETVCVEAARLLAEQDAGRYRHVIVDEAQDLAPWHWRMLRAAVAPARDDLFLAGDTHQRIYDNRVSLKQVGIDIAGRSQRLTVNYRTTAEILGWSLGLLRGEPVDDMDGSLDSLAGCRSEVHGPAPVLSGAPTRAAGMDSLIATVRGWLADGVKASQIGIAARLDRQVDYAVAALTAAGLVTVSLARRAARDGEISAATMHRMKGLEFRCVAVVEVGEHQVPASSAITPAEDDQLSHDLDLQRERCLLFVACTRAREQLSVSWYGRPSALLTGVLRAG